MPSLHRLRNFIGSPRFPIFMILFTDVLGLGITIPVLPLFAKNELRAEAWQITALTSVYFVAAFFGGPWLGRLSDRVGRRPVLVLSQVGTLTALLLTGLAPGLYLLYIARVIDGLTGGNISVAQAYMSDISDERHRAQGLGLVSASFGLGFIVGPAFGGLAAGWFGPRVPFFIAAGVSVCTVLLSIFLLPESLSAERRRREQAAKAALPPSNTWDLLRVPLVAILMTVTFGSNLAFFAWQTVHVLWAQQVVLHGLTDALVQQAVGGALAFVGACGLLTQFSLIGPLVKRFGEQRLVIGGRLATGSAFALMALVPIPAVWLLSLPFAAVGNGLAVPSQTALLTYAAPPGQRGQVIGLMQSFASAGSVLGPLVSGYLFESVSAGAAVLSSGMLMGLTVLVALLVLRYPVERPTPVQPAA
jgi:DHA1 family tetracycline resistance protein-like MFS transporter